MTSGKTICGANCSECSNQANCPGCVETKGRPCGGRCVAAECICKNGHAAYQELKAQLCGELNALQIPGLPEITALNELPGAYVNLEYPLPNGTKVKLLDDCCIYLGNQLPDERHPDSERCFGILADEERLIVCTYGPMGADPELICYRKREQ